MTPAPTFLRRPELRRIILGTLLAALLALTTTGCASASKPTLDARNALGTVVSVTAYPAEGVEDAETLRPAIDAAYGRMFEVERALDVHDPDSAIARHNAEGGSIPQEAQVILAAIERLGVGEYFSPHLLDVVALYDFEGERNVPSPDELTAALASRRYDFGGAAKGLALDQAAAELSASPDVQAALVTAGSTTITLGGKPDGSHWRIGIEDPRDPESTFASIETRGNLTVSTSGDYQRYFERDGVRYHHILDPATGLPASGLRSLTVVGEISALDSDILSTALFVMGPEAAEDYARSHGLGLVMVTSDDQVIVIEGPTGAEWTITESRQR